MALQQWDLQGGRGDSQPAQRAPSVGLAKAASGSSEDSAGSSTFYDAQPSLPAASSLGEGTGAGGSAPEGLEAPASASGSGGSAQRPADESGTDEQGGGPLVSLAFTTWSADSSK